MILRLCLITALLLATLLSGCTSLVQAPVITLKETGITGLDSSGVDLIFQLGVTNPNPFDLSLLGYTFDLQVLDRPLSSGGKQDTILFPAGAETAMHLPVRLTYTDLLQIINRAPDLDLIPYQLKSILHVKTPLGELSIPITKTAQLAIPRQYRPAAFINRLQDALRGIR